MFKFKEKLLENDFGAYLYDKRCQKEWTIEELVQKINMPTVTIKSIKKWEHDLEFPNLDQLYKLSEIYEIPSEELMQVKTNTLQEGLKGVHKALVRFIGYLFGFSIYGTMVIGYIGVYGGLIIAFIYFLSAASTGIQNYH